VWLPQPVELVIQTVARDTGAGVSELKATVAGAADDFEAIWPRRTLRQLEQAATLLLSEGPRYRAGDWCSRQ
jgi:hypothetical protein